MSSNSTKKSARWATKLAEKAALRAAKRERDTEIREPEVETREMLERLERAGTEQETLERAGLLELEITLD